jgi:Leucine-rich repeat (LRR) protein
MWLVQDLLSFCSDLCDLTNLLCPHQELMIDKNRLAKLPTSCGNLASLVKLNASNNKLVSLPESLGECSALEELKVRENQLASLPDGIRNCSKLVHLDLANNLFVLKPDDLVVYIDSLSYLDLQGNPCMMGK